MKHGSSISAEILFYFSGDYWAVSRGKYEKMVGSHRKNSRLEYCFQILLISDVLLQEPVRTS
jgi:hypothetical protein